MQINLTGHHCQITDAMRTFTQEKFNRLITRCGIHATRINIVLNVDKLLQTAEATLHFPGAEIHASDTTKDMYSAIDGLIDKLERQIKKHREKSDQ